MKADATPKKEFFVRMLTRDISLQDCILDLIDNSIDAAWKAAGTEPKTLQADSRLADYRVDVALSEDSFEIRDNCTGISLESAEKYAFTFGRSKEQANEEYSVGVYGIGMKRAVFKIGSEVAVESTYRSDGAREAFRVVIDVPSWLDEEEWDFPIEQIDSAESSGVRILVKDLHDDTRALFGDAIYQRSLRRVLARDYMVPLMRGLRITVNGQDVVANSIELRQNDQFSPMRHRYADGSVEIEILAGMIAAPPDDTDPDDDRGENPYGWYVACNGRIVLAADRTALTGWGETLPRWHRQYDGFVGIVFFSAEDPSLLPMTTTKRSVDASSAVYRRALAKMYEPARAWVDYTNARKSDLDAVKQLEETTTPADLVSVSPSETLSLPELKTTTRTRERMAHVNYSLPRKRLTALADAFGDKSMTNRDVGLQSFQFAYDELVDEDD